MKKLITMMVTTFFLSALPMLTLAASHDHGSMSGGSMMQHGDKKSDMPMNQGGMDHSGHDHGSTHDAMMAEGGMMMIGEHSMHGVKCMAHLKDVKAAMAKMGMKTTHHFMAAFSDDKSGKDIEKGTVAVKITAPDGTVTGPVELMGMQGHFGADVVLDKPGEYTFQIGSKLADGTVRQYEFKTTVK